MDGIDGRKHLVEETLDHLDGNMGSKPARIGNGAYNQLQLDIYGELLDAAYLYNKHGAPISYDLWTSLTPRHFERRAHMPEDAKEAIGHGVRAKRSKSGAVSFDVLEPESTHAAVQ